MTRSTHTVAILEVPRSAFGFIKQKLEEAGYQHAIDDEFVDMTGIGVVPIDQDPTVLDGGVSDVRDFIEASEGEPPNRPTLPNAERESLYARLITEEVIETLSSIHKGDLEGIADGIVDSIYVLLFAAIYYGLPISEVWAEVQRANMSKRWPDGKFHQDERGKIIKPPGWKPPDIKSIIERAMR